MGKESEGEGKLTQLDRSIKILVDEPTASATEGIEPSTERIHRLHGTSLIHDASTLLSLGASTFATACTIFHRFCHQCSLYDYDVWSVAAASILLAIKIEEEPYAMKGIIHVFAHLYRKRIMLATTETPDQVKSHPLGASLPAASTLSLEEKHQRMGKVPLPSKLGPVYKEWHSRISKMEAIVLRQLGFTLYWIPDSHPHKFIACIYDALELTDVKLAQRAWEYCNDSYRLDLCVRFPSEVIATSAFFLASCDLKITLPTNPTPWWEYLVGKGKEKDISSITNVLLGLQSAQDGSTFNNDMMLASLGFVKTIQKTKGETMSSFNGVGSFLWDHQSEVFAKEM
ncbi:unnamed protein product [Cylindrotheca closterium]|uniref:Cyclin-like domain-containing protein n=1 Tax=Cylindrotheca closterium TaxID=2856 RepID=A0AAD2FLV2_9STRA|nr:unnamed protein product [Cylindrotheca closterium]